MISRLAAITGQLVGDHHARPDALLLEQLAEQAPSGFHVASALNQNVEHDPMLIHGTPEPMLPARDADDNFVEMPFVSGGRKTPADLISIILAEFQRPLPRRLMADQDPSGRQHLLDHA
jgi:hypothetical protein